jgi:hypothetical protein
MQITAQVFILICFFTIAFLLTIILPIANAIKIMRKIYPSKISVL